MPVTFTTKALIDAATEAVSGHLKADEQYQRDAAEYRRKYAEEHDMLPQLKALCDELTAFLKTRRQPTADDARRFRAAVKDNDYLRNMYVGGLTLWDVSNNVAKPSGWLAPSTVASYQGLIKMLQAHTEDTITANQLKLFGYDRLEPMFRAAALYSPVVDQ